VVEHYDVVVLGGGSGNTVIDESFRTLRVAIIEPGPLGGTCLNRGCIPSKMYVYAADVLAAARRGPELGVRTAQHGADWHALRSRVIGTIDEEAEDGRRGRADDSDVDLITGSARFIGERRLIVTTGADEKEITADQIVIAAGSRPVVPSIPGLDQAHHHTSDTIMRLHELPRRLAILGGGYVGCEFAHVFSMSGSSVTLVENGEVLLSNQDRELSERFTRTARERWEVSLGDDVERVTAKGDVSRLHLTSGGTVDADVILVAVGRQPNGDRLGLEAAGVAVDDDGLIVVDKYQRTTAEKVWALGDVCQGQPLKHVANHEARVVQHNLLNPDDLQKSDHRFVPNAVFSQPPLAAVGLTEQEAEAAGVEVAIGRAEFSETAYGWAMRSGSQDTSSEATGLVKLLADRKTGRLVGAHLMGTHASILIQPLIQAISFDQDVRTLARGQYWIHPALTEVIEKALLDLCDSMD
jgi:mycothione reductase